jgi:hypothetical protein
VGRLDRDLRDRAHLQLASGHGGSGSWRPLFVDDVGSRLNVALLSRAGIRDVLISAWVVGAPLLVVAASLWKRHRDLVILTLCYAIPSVLFLIFFWPVQGLGVDTGHVVAAFSRVLRGRVALLERAPANGDRRGAADLGAPGVLAHGARHTLRELAAVALNVSLLRALRIVVAADSDPVRQVLFANLMQARRLVRIAYRLHERFAGTWASAVLISSYGLGYFLRITPPRAACRFSASPSTRMPVARSIACAGG